MAVANIDGFYLGVGGDMDPDETNFTPENPNFLNGFTTGSAANPLYQRIETIGLDDGGFNNNNTFENDRGQTGGDIIYGGTGSPLDNVSDMNVTITYTDGSSVDTQMTLIHDESGRYFLLPMRSGSAQNQLLDDHPIESVRFNSTFNDNYGGLSHNRPSSAFVTCFAAGTRLRCPGGYHAIETLKIGDRVMTTDSGAQPIRWIGRSIGRSTGDWAPVQIEAHAFGPGQPTRAIRVSQQHRLLIRSRIADRMFGNAEILVAAKKLLDVKGVSLAPQDRPISYHHLMFARHEILCADGLAVESFYPGPCSMDTMSEHARRACLAHWTPTAPMARPVVTNRRRIARLLQRHRKNAHAFPDRMTVPDNRRTSRSRQHA